MGLSRSTTKLARPKFISRGMAGPLSYIGGKNRLAKGLIEIFPKHTTYVEAFAGGAQVFFRKEPSKVLFYLDPPYWGRKLYRHNFGEADFEKLAGQLKNIRGKFILSLNDIPEVRKLFGDFHIRGVELHYTSQKAAGKRPSLMPSNSVKRVITRSPEKLPLLYKLSHCESMTYGDLWVYEELTKLSRLYPKFGSVPVVGPS